MRKVLLSFIIGAVVIGAAALVAGTPDSVVPAPSPTAVSPAFRSEVVRVDPWQLFQHNGEQLYDGLCASCHGAEGAGAGPAARIQAVYPPPLNRLKKAGVPEEHWTYVILAPCEDGHHWGPQEAATMPCWQRVFRQALGGNNAGPTLVSAKLTEYLKEIQE